MIEKLVGENLTKDSCCPELEWKTRIIGFAITAILGIGGFIFLLMPFSLLLPGAFVVVFSCSSVCCVLSTFFLMGPKKQWASMMKPQRMITSIIYIISFVLTIVTSILDDESFFKYIFMGIQLASFIWYVLSYIPFAQKCCSSCMKNCLKEVKGETA